MTDLHQCNASQCKLHRLCGMQMYARTYIRTLAQVPNFRQPTYVVESTTDQSLLNETCPYPDTDHAHGIRFTAGITPTNTHLIYCPTHRTLTAYQNVNQKVATSWLSGLQATCNHKKNGDSVFACDGAVAIVNNLFESCHICILPPVLLSMWTTRELGTTRVWRCPQHCNNIHTLMNVKISLMKTLNMKMS